MMIGEYPCCDGPLFLPLPEDRPLPTFQPEACPHCGAKVWHRFSRADPQTWTEAGFLAEFDVDAEARTITPKGEAAEARPVLRALLFKRFDEEMRRMEEQWLDDLLYGTARQ